MKPYRLFARPGFGSHFDNAVYTFGCRRSSTREFRLTRSRGPRTTGLTTHILVLDGLEATAEKYGHPFLRFRRVGRLFTIVACAK
jgi:hypothetical protein